MSYRVEFSPPALRQFLALPRPIQERLTPRIDSLVDDPRPHGVEKLTGPEVQYRIRVGDYRIVYEIRDDQLMVLLLRIGHRRDIYRRR